MTTTTAIRIGIGRPSPATLSATAGPQSSWSGSSGSRPSCTSPRRSATRPAPRRTFRLVNVEAVARLLDAAGGRPVVWVSSISVYAPGPRCAVGEDHPMVGQRSAYGRTMAAGDRLAQQAGAVVLRPHAVYGALHWEPGPYHVTDAEPYRRDDALRRVLGAVTGRDLVVRHLPVGPLRAAAAAMERVTRRGEPALSRYGLDLLTSESTYDLTRALAQGYRPVAGLADHLARLTRPAS